MSTRTLQHPHSSSSRPAFDTDLVDQIIEIEVDTAVRRLEAGGRHIDNATAHVWNLALQEVLTHMAVEEQEQHCLLPRDFQEMLQETLQNLIDADTDALPQACLPREGTSVFRWLYRFIFRIT